MTITIGQNMTYLKNIPTIMYRCKIMSSGARLENFFNIFGQNMLIENLNSMLSEVRQKSFEIFCVI